MRTDTEVLAHVHSVVVLHGCEALALTPPAVAVKGDNRQRGPGVIIRFPDNMPTFRRMEVATIIGNTVPEVCRVLAEECARKDPP
jgi:hypothetical protein